MASPPEYSLENPGDRHLDNPEDFFEKAIRPLLVSKCSSCHGPEKEESGLRVDSRESILQGGKRGAAIAAGDAAGSRVVAAVRRSGDLKMPPGAALAEHEIQALERWIESGAPWPAAIDGAPQSRSDAREKTATHWAFQGVRVPKIPELEEHEQISNPIDAFVLARLEASGLEASPPADRRTLIRRVSYTLLGLPPDANAVRDFVADPRRDAYERLVDRLLESRQYGERWARHWLDVARYSDTKGYVYGREERTWVHAWVYRDWLVRALNSDMPYDRFLLLQLAADQVDDRDPGDLAAMGFLTLGRRFLGVTREIIDDRIDVVTRGTMALTVSCARCHDHKYDPIATADYYSLYGVFDSSIERLERIPQGGEKDSAFEDELARRQEALRSRLAASRLESSNRVRERIGDYLRAQTRLHDFPAEGFDQLLQPGDLLPAFVRRWEEHLRRARIDGNPIFVPWHTYALIPAKTFARRSIEVTRALHEAKPGEINPLVAAVFRDAPQSFDDVIERYARVFSELDARWKKTIGDAAASGAATATMLPDPAAESIRRVLHGEGAPCEVPDVSIVNCEGFFDTGRTTELWKLQGEVDRLINGASRPAPFALVLVDRPVPSRPRVFHRGNPLDQRQEVPRQFLPLLSKTPRPFQKGSGRLELAREIVSPANPLTARVIVNRVWAHHFGRGLVSTPSDFGLRSAPPSHPELLDWLAARLVAGGWSLKKLHRSILLSTTFRQASTGPSDPAARANAMAVDPDIRLLWRARPRRLSFEEIRDSMLVVAGDLDPQIGGRPFDLFAQPFNRRRTLYGRVDRQFLPTTLRTFDFANPDLHIPARRETTVPQQALFFMNHPLVLDRARSLARHGREATTRDDGIRAMFQRVYQRDPGDAELAEARELLRVAAPVDVAASTAKQWRYGFGTFDEERGRVEVFTELPHFTGDAWQGGSALPDGKLGWVQLTATGGHPGNDQRHASIRRWTAPRALTLRIESRLEHEPREGDGIRARIVSSRGGLLSSARIQQKAVALDIETLSLEAGENVDFVVDIGGTLSHDQYLWEITIHADATPAPGAPGAWNSKADFTPNLAQRLDGREQLAQLLLSTNEFMFVD